MSSHANPAQVAAEKIAVNLPNLTADELAALDTDEGLIVPVDHGGVAVWWEDSTNNTRLYALTCVDGVDHEASVVVGA